MLYVAQTQGPTVQLGALSCRFFAPDRDTLVINKLTRLELSTVDADSVSLAAEVPVFSSIAAVQSVHLPGHDTASLIVLTTCLRLFILTADLTAPTASPRVLTGSSISIHEPFGRLAEYQDILVDPGHRCVVVHAYSGLVRVVPLPSVAGGSGASTSRNGSRSASDAREIDLSTSYNVRLSTLNISSLAFLPHSPAAPVLAAVYASHTGHKVLATYTVDLAEKELGDGPLPEQVLADPGSEIAIPLAGGVAVVGEESLTWYAVKVAGGEDDAKGKGRALDSAGSPAVRCRLPVSRVTAWTALSADRILLGDLFGKLLLVTATLAGAERVTGLAVQDLGDTTSATSIVPLSPSTVYLSSRFGDSQLVRLPVAGPDAMEDESVEEKDLELVASYASLAPILDFVLVADSASSSSGYLVTCSGAYKTGSLRVVRRGVGLQELASLDVDGVQRVWSFDAGLTHGQLLVLGFFDETRVFRLVAGEADPDELDLDEVDLPFFDAAAATLFAGALAGELAVQVTAQGVAYDGSRWAPEGGKKVTAAAAREGGDKIAVAVEGGGLVVLRAEGGTLVQTGSTVFQHDVAALALSPSSSHAAVALWTSQEVHLVDLSGSPLASCATHTIDSTFLIRSVALTSFSSTLDGSATLLAGLGDGTLVSLPVDLAPGAGGGGGSFAAAGAKAVPLGRRPLQLTEIAHGEDRAVFVASDRPTIVSRSKDRLVYSGVNLADTHAVAPLPNGTLALASPSSLTLGRIGAIQQVDVRTVPLDEDEPRRIAHDPRGRCFVVACARRDVDRKSGEMSVRGVVRLLGEDFETRATLQLDPGEEAQSLTLAHASSGEALFVVCTTRAPASADAEPTEGRLLTLRATVTDASGTLEQVSATRVGGCPYAVVPLEGPAAGYIAVAVNAQVGVWALDAEEGPHALVATWGGAFVAYTLAARADGTLLVGDALRSVTLLRFHLPASAPLQGRLDELARDYRSRYMLGVAPLAGAGGDVLGAETDLNLFTLERGAGAGAGLAQDAGMLEARGQWHLGEMVSRFRPGSLGQLVGDSSGAVSPQLVYASSAGSIGVVASLSDEAGRVLSGVERNLRAVVHGVGGLEQEEYRAYKSDKTTLPSAGFVDGSFVEQFLDLAPDVQEQVVGGRSEHERLEVGTDAVGRLLEEVARVH